jgi:hypothetical protein
LLPHHSRDGLEDATTPIVVLLVALIFGSLQGTPEKLNDQLLLSDDPFQFGDPLVNAAGHSGSRAGLLRTASFAEIRFAPLIHAAHPNHRATCDGCRALSPRAKSSRQRGFDVRLSAQRNRSCSFI